MSNPKHKAVIRNLVSVVIFAASATLLAHDFQRPSTVQATSADTPIKVGGGSMTFLSKYTWKPTTSGWCADVKANDLNAIAGEHFFDPTATYQVTDPIFNDAGQNWTIQILGHANSETTTFAHGANGVTMTAAPSKCGGTGSGYSLTIEPIQGGDLKTYIPLVGTRYHKDNHRYADPSCSDRDRCERMAQVIINGTGSPYDGQVFTCPDGECRIYIGLAESIGFRATTTSHRRRR